MSPGSLPLRLPAAVSLGTPRPAAIPYYLTAENEAAQFPQPYHLDWKYWAAGEEFGHGWRSHYLSQAILGPAKGWAWFDEMDGQVA